MPTACSWWGDEGRSSYRNWWGLGYQIRIIHAIRVYLECILDVFWMMITMFQSDYRDIT